MLKKGIQWDILVYWIIALVVLGISLIIYAILNDGGRSMLEYIQNLFKFR